MDALVIDIHHFRMINERYGKAYGDEVLKRIGERIRDMVSSDGGIVCRREADTFLVYCPHREDYESIVDNASQGILKEHSSSGRLRLRMGVYADVDKDIEIERRFDRAKMAADTIRSNFIRTVALYDNKLHETEIYEEHLIEDFYRALDEKQFTVYYQPKFDVRPVRPALASAEALVRWQHPEFGMISPGIFIPLFEDNGLIQQLDQYVWREAAYQIRTWKDKFGISIPVSVNVSRIDMYDPELISTFNSILNESGITASDLLLEITESAYTQDSAQIISTVNELRDLGFRIEMDDFGTGYSSLNMISSLPIDALKLDMKFIRNAFREGRDTRLIEVIIDIADYLSVPVIAEGVETEEQLTALTGMGCDLVQGYYFSKPVPPDEYEVFLEKRRELSESDTKAAVRTSVRTDQTSLTYASIAQALAADYFSIYYVNTETDQFVEFSAHDDYNELGIEKGGDDFFNLSRTNILRVVHSDDHDMILRAFTKDNLMAGLEENGTFTLNYRLMFGDTPSYVSMKATKMADKDDKHIVIGVNSIDAQIRRQEEFDAERARTVTYARVAQALSHDYFSIYLVNTDTDEFIEYSSSSDFKELQVEQSGTDFFEDCRRNVIRLVHKEDLDMALAVWDKSRLMPEIESGSTFSTTYRIMMDGRPVYINCKVIRLTDDEQDSKYIVIGVSNVDAQMKRERELNAARERANRDPLTGVKSKHAYTDSVDLINSDIEAGTAREFAVAVCDLNGLKSINDTYGHQAGDKLIREASHIICEVFKHSPVYRIGGDEFVAVLYGSDYENRDELISSMKQSNDSSRDNGGVVIACGCSEWRAGEDKDFESVFERADAAMYMNKSALKN